MKQSPSVKINTITAQSLNQRLDNYLFKHLKGVPKSHIYQLLRKGRVRVNGKRAKPVYKLQLDDQVRIPPVRLPDEKTVIKPTVQAIETLKAAIVFDHPDFLVLNKPINFAVHGGSRINYGVIDVLRAMDPETPYELVHRLDRATSGCLLVAKSRLSLNLLQNCWREDQVRKEYLAVLLGHLKSPNEIVEAPLLKRRRGDDESYMVVDPLEGKSSKTTFKEIERYEKTSLVRVLLQTGRMHQIRVHSQFIGHPIFGDDKYGDKLFNQAHKAKRLFLHAQCLQFVYAGETIKVEIPWNPAL